MQDRNPNHAVNLLERVRDRAFNRYARRGEYETYYALVNATLGPICEGEWRRNKLPNRGGR